MPAIGDDDLLTVAQPVVLAVVRTYPIASVR